MKLHPFLKGFVRLLQENEHVRTSWVALLSAATRGEAESCLFSFHICLQHCAPDFWAAYDILSLRVWVRNTVLAYREGRYTDPFQPWESRGRPRRDLQETVEMVLRLMLACYAERRQPTQPYIGAHWDHEHSDETTDFASTARYLRANGYPWKRLQAMAWARHEKK